MHTRSFTSVRTGLLALLFALFAPMAFGQMPQGNTKTLSSSDVTDKQVKKAAQVMMALQTSGRQMQMKMRKEMKQKYGNPSQMDSTQKAAMKREARKKQREMRKKQMKMMQQKTKEVGLNPKRFRRIMMSARQDSTLQQRLRQAMKAQMKQKQPQMGGGQGSGSGSSNQ